MRPNRENPKLTYEFLTGESLRDRASGYVTATESQSEIKVVPLSLKKSAEKIVALTTLLNREIDSYNKQLSIVRVKEIRKIEAEANALRKAEKEAEIAKEKARIGKSLRGTAKILYKKDGMLPMERKNALKAEFMEFCRKAGKELEAK